MIEYNVIIDPENGAIIQGDFSQGSVAVNIPNDNPKKRQFISLFYCNCTREELLSYGKPPFKLATTKDPEKKR